MLKILRRKEVSRVVFWGLVILILPAFVLWGTGGLSGSKDKGPRSVGIIDKKEVSFDKLYEAITATRSLLVLNYFNQPQALETILRDKPLLGKLGWDRLIMLKEARRYRIKIPDEDVIAFIRSHPLFLSRDGAFDEKLYGYFLKYNMGLEPRAFEEIIRSNLEVQILNDMLTKDITASDEEVLSEYKKELSALKEPKVFDKEKFAKEKGEFSKKVLEIKRTGFLEDWLRRLEAGTKLNIDFKDMEKYYK